MCWSVLQGIAGHLTLSVSVTPLARLSLLNPTVSMMSCHTCQTLYNQVAWNNELYAVFVSVPFLLWWLCKCAELCITLACYIILSFQLFSQNLSTAQTGLPMLEGLSLLIDSLGPGILVHATARGDINTIQTFLQRHPDQVNTLPCSNCHCYTLSLSLCWIWVLPILMVLHAWLIISTILLVSME